ncbi:MAG: hypothetical protein HY289_01625 [Planctomycetes bacterium]|nr:hypothetical protein [Planctomycetota bacterium]
MIEEADDVAEIENDGFHTIASYVKMHSASNRKTMEAVMPSASLLRWQADRLPSLTEFDAQCSASVALSPPNPRLVDENLRGYVVLLSAHFQGFCRDLCTEAAQIIASKVRPGLKMVVQTQFAAHRKLDRGNPTLENLRDDFRRFGFRLDVAAVDPANVARSVHLSTLNAWRNIAAHQGMPTSAAGSLSLPLLRAWRDSCDGLATSLDGIMYNQLRSLLKRAPW